MGEPGLRDLLGATFRANPDYELLPFQRLSPGEQAALAGLREDPDLYGILRPRGGGAASVKSVGHDTALLLLALKTPGPLPPHLRHRLGPDCNEAVARLVLDDVLQLRSGDAFVGGVDAHPLVHAGPAPAPSGRITRLSLDALRHASGLALDSAPALANRLYLYNAVPLSPRWARDLPDATSTAAWLGLGEDLELHHQGPWFHWRSRDARALAGQLRWTWKLYVSPRPEELPRAVRPAARVLAEASASAFKVGADARGVLRPDKLVAYFAERVAMERAGERLRRELGGMSAQGVPFTADPFGDALVSYGADPPAERHTVSWLRQESWRLYVVHRLAAALLLAKRTPASAVPPWRFALDRLRLEGLDSTDWLPSEEDPS